MGCSSTPAITTKKRILFVIGAPYCGKEALCTRIKENFEWEYYDYNKIVQHAIGHSSKEKIIFNESILKYMGKLFRDKSCMKIILDNFPPNIESLKKWNKKMGKEYEIQPVLYIKCNKEIMKQRVAEDTNISEDKRRIICNEIDNFDENQKMLFKELKSKDLLKVVNSEKVTDELIEEIKQLLSKQQDE